MYLTPIAATRFKRISLTWNMKTDENYHYFALILNYSRNRRVPQVMSVNKHHCATYASCKHHLVNILHLPINKILYQREIYQPTDGVVKL